MELKPGINLLIGDNGSGKTSLLMACKYAMSAFFSGFSDDNTRLLSFSNADFYHRVHDNGLVEPEQSIAIEFGMEDIFPDFQDILVLSKNSAKNTRMHVSGIKTYSDYSKNMMKSLFCDGRQVKALPLFAVFSTEDIHSRRKVSANHFKTYNQKNSFAYYECLGGEGFFRYWRDRMLVLNEGNRDEELNIVITSLQEVLGVNGSNIIREVQVRPVAKDVFFILTDGREVASHELSDGYRRVINIVMDIAFRCAILNRGIYGNECARQTRGMVLIDEVDMHLHPALQSTLLRALHNSFPLLQIIATTHAPLVMSGVDDSQDNIVCKMNYSADDGYSITPVTTYGMDVNSIVQQVLNITPREVKVEEALSRLFDAIDREHYDEAKKLLAEMRKRFDIRLPELARAETLIDLMS